MRPSSARVRLGTANSREMEQLSVLLDFMRDRQRAGRPVLLPRQRPARRERFDTQHLIAQLRRVHRRTQTAPLLLMLFASAACLGPVVARVFGWV